MKISFDSEPVTAIYDGEGALMTDTMDGSVFTDGLVHGGRREGETLGAPQIHLRRRREFRVETWYCDEVVKKGERIAWGYH